MTDREETPSDGGTGSGAARKRKSQGDQAGVVTLSTGVKLRIKKMSIMLVTDIVAEKQRQRPKPPVTFIKTLGRHEENPLDPDYLERKDAWQAEMATAVNDAMVLEGTEPILPLPRGIAGPDDKDFLERMRTLGREPISKSAKYLAWVKYVAAPTQDDVTTVIAEVGKQSGVPEAGVQAAVETFRS
jgi:hypothetical protein